VRSHAINGPEVFHSDGYPGETTGKSRENFQLHDNLPHLRVNTPVHDPKTKKKCEEKKTKRKDRFAKERQSYWI